MKKIPTMFERDWAADRSRVLDKIHAGCEWVQAGEGIATRKLDGTCCLVQHGRLYKRREIRPGDLRPADFDAIDHDDETGKTVGWVPVTDTPEDRWHREAFKYPSFEDGTYELIGPKVQGNPERFPQHALISHKKTTVYTDAPRTFAALGLWFQSQDIEGLVFHHPDGRMAKIKKRDFGLKRS